jgi:hypothetical protein
MIICADKLLNNDTVNLRTYISRMNYNIVNIEIIIKQLCQMLTFLLQVSKCIIWKTKLKGKYLIQDLSLHQA